MESYEQQVKVGILTGGPHRIDNFAQLVIFEGPTSIGEAARLLQVSGWTSWDESCALGTSEKSAQRADAVLAG
jgi:hypothetical protein